MIKKNNVVKNIILVITVVALMGLIVYLVGRSYGFFRYEKQGETTNVITIKGIRVDIIEDDDALNLLNTEPLYDSDGMQLKAFKFSITNTSSRPLDYTMKVVNDTDKQSACLINEGTANEAACPVLTTDNIRYSYKLNNSNWVEPSNLGLDNDVITTYTINGGETLTYSIKMWIKSDATNDIMNHYFFGQLLIQGTQAAQEMYRPYDVATILSNFNQEDLKEVVACSNDNRYQDCEIYNTIEEAIAAKSKSLIIVTNDITKTSTITIAQGKDVTLDLNGKNIATVNPDDLNEENTTYSDRYYTFVVQGNLTLNSTNGGNVSSYIGSETILVRPTGNLVINGGNYNGRRSISSSGTTTINGGTFAAKGNYDAVYVGGGTTTINDGTYTSKVRTDKECIININGGHYELDASQTGNVVNITGSGTININGGTFISSVSSTINNASTTTGVINITAGTFISPSNIAIYNSGSGIINITQTDKPIYITSLAESFRPAIVNLSAGTINITASRANQCTATASDTTSGLCVYGNATGNGAVRNVDGIININGGTYYGNEQGTHNGGTGTYNIKNATIICQKSAIYNHSTGTYNICDTTINSITSKDISNVSTGTVNYNNVTFSTGTTTPDPTKITGTITEAATCPIAE